MSKQMWSPEVKRHVLHEKLLSFAKDNGIVKVYFQPPESVRMDYPCIVYKFNNMETNSADNLNYFKNQQYQITLIDSDPDNMIRLLDEFLNVFATSTFLNSFRSNNLYHNVLNLNY